MRINQQLISSFCLKARPSISSLAASMHIDYKVNATFL